ncbi:MAG: hypothetical protein KDD51_06030 [Bdellovibrionales bacterium]|nr:hypothetical protein [Bdellovibrionales bacterium]
MSESDTLWCVDVYAVESDGRSTYTKSLYYRNREAAIARAIEINRQEGFAAVLGSSKLELANCKLEFADDNSPSKKR